MKLHPEHMEIVTANPFEDDDEGHAMQELFLSENTALNLWEIILQDQTMYFPPTELPNSSLPFL